MSALVPRATVDSIVAHRNTALTLYGEAYEALSRASEALLAAGRAAALASPGLNRFNYHSDLERRTFLEVLKVPKREDFIKSARRLTDTDVWSHIVAITDLERLMDKKAKDQLHRQLIDDPPEVTAENVFATLDQFALDADTIFKRGIAECFSNLDRRFRSHDGWKIGSRVILSYAFDTFGSWNFHRSLRDTMIDIERAFLVLDGKSPTSAYSGIVARVEADRRDGNYGAKQSESDSDYFKVRVYKNGNAHIWFKRDDLVREVNKLLGEYYGAPIPEERDADPDDGLNVPKTALAKNFGFYPTPDAVASALLDHCLAMRRHYSDGSTEPLKILEPSAGLGALARRCAVSGAVVDCVEVHHDRASQLRASGLYRRVTQADFLALQPDESRLYDRVVMNPPFDRERDIDHVLHALRFLGPDGYLTAIMSAGTEFRETRKSIAFRALMTKMHAHFADLPAGSFASVGTYCNTIVLRVWKDGRSFC